MRAVRLYRVPKEKKESLADEDKQKVLQSLAYPNDYRYICMVYDSLFQNASLTMTVLNIGNTRMYSALKWRKDPDNYQHGGKEEHQKF